MRLLKAGLLLVVMSGLCAASLHAYEPGDFAPRGSLLYARVNDLSGSLDKLGGEAWTSQVERMLYARSSRDVEESEPIINEIRKFVDYLGTTEFVISDVMVREPYMQMALVAQLKEGAPAEFSPEFVEFFKEQSDETEATSTSIKFENGSLWLKGSVFVLSSGGMMDAHVQDVLEGYTDESLSKVERFTKWSAKAKGDVVLFADMKAWRTGIDRLGEDFDSDLRQALDVVEWQKWDMITGSATLPGNTSGGISIDLSLSLNQPFEHVNAFLKPTGGSRLISVLPAETVGFLSLQLGREHQRTFNELLTFFHDFEQNNRPAQIKRRIRWAEEELEWAEEHLKDMKDIGKDDKDKDAAGNPEPQNRPRGNSARSTEKTKPVDGGEEEEYDPVKDATEGVERAKQRLAELREELEACTYRTFQPDPEQRQGRETEAEGFSDGFDRAIAEFGFTREEVLSAIGHEAMLGMLDLPDPGFDGNDPGDAYGEMWFVLVETQETFPELKERFLDRMLARKFPADMPEEEKERAKRQAEKAMFKKVEGGELIRERGLRADWCAFAGEGFVGFAPNEEVALKILKAGLGQGRMGTSKIPAGGVSGSKFGYIDLGSFLGKIATGTINRQRRYASFPNPFFDLEKFMPAGFHLSISSDESSQGVLFSLRTGGEGDASGALDMFAEEIANEKASRHDESELYELQRSIESWYADQRDALGAMEAAERTRTIKAVTPQTLIASGGFAPLDGLRSAFDPAMEARFQHMLENHLRRLGPGKDVEDRPNDLSESGFEWFGLPTDLALDNDDYDSDYDYKGGRSNNRSGALICAMKGSWAHGGRFAMIWSNGPRVVWYDDADYAALQDATRNGKAWEPANRAEANPPKWRVRKLLRNKQYELDNLYGSIQTARRRAAEENRELQLKFNGKDKENAFESLRELLGLTEDDWFYFEGAKNLTITTDAAGKATARYEEWGHWIQMDDEGNVTSSLDD